MTKLRFFPLVAFAIAAATFAAGCGSGAKSVGANEVAVVGDCSISKEQYNHLLDQARKSYKAQKIDLHRRLVLTESEDELAELEAATIDRYGPLPEPVGNLFAIQAAKLKLALLGADYLVFKGGRSTVGPLHLGSEDLRALRARVDTAVYATARNEVSVKHEDFPEALELVDAILETRRAA